MNCIYRWLLLSCFTFIATQLEAQSHTYDTIFYQKKGKPILLQPKWLVQSQPDSFYCSHSDLDIKNGDTTKQEFSHFIFKHKVDSIVRDSVLHSFWATPVSYGPRLNTRDCKVLEINNIYQHFSYMTPRSGVISGLLAMRSCEEAGPRFDSLFQKAADCVRSKDKSPLINAFLSAGKNNPCYRLAGMITPEVLMLHIPYGCLVPKKKRIGYEIRAKSEKSSMSQYNIVDVTVLPNGNRLYTIQEDTTKAAPVFARMMRDMGKMEQFTKNPFGKKEKMHVEASELLELEVDQNNHLVMYKRRFYTYYKRENGKPNISVMEDIVRRL